MQQKVDFGKLKAMQEQLAKQVSLDDGVSPQTIKYIAGFSVSYVNSSCICAAIVLEYATLKVVEKKFATTKAPMQYVPGFLAFREGPAICQLYYDLEYEPDVILVNGHGVAHPLNCGLATFVGVELGKPVIGIAKNLLIGEEKDGDILVDGEALGRVLKTKEHANPLYVSPGTLVSLDTAVAICTHCVVPPHKLPEPLHIAHRLSKAIASEHQNKTKSTVKEKVEKIE